MDNSGRHALVVSSSRYSDPSLRPLTAPTEDAEALAVVLRDPDVGAFRVREVVDQPSWVVAEEVERFFTERGPNDVALFYFTGHGIKDEDGALYFAAMNTKTQLLRSTAVPSDHMVAAMRRCRSRRQVLLLDCCYAGAFSRAMLMKGNERVDVQERFTTDGAGRVVITASDAMQYAFEGDRVEGEAELSLFTRALVEGMRTGEADRNSDGLVSLDELYDYVYDAVRRLTPNQTPTTSNLDKRGEIVIARNPRAQPANGAGAGEATAEAAKDAGSHVAPTTAIAENGATVAAEPERSGLTVAPPATRGQDEPSASETAWTAELLEKNWFMRKLRVARGRLSHVLEYHWSVTSPRVALDGTTVSSEYTGMWSMKHRFSIPTDEREHLCIVEVKQAKVTLRITGFRLLIDNEIVYADG